MHKHTPEVPAPVPLSSNRKSMALPSIVGAMALSMSSMALLLRPQASQEFSPPAAAATPQAKEQDASLQELAELPEGQSMIGREFLVHCEQEGVRRSIKICIEREEATQDLVFRINGRVFRNDESIPVVGGKATQAIKSIVSHEDGFMRLSSPGNGHTDVPFDHIRKIAPQLADTQESKLTVETNVVFIPDQGTIQGNLMTSGQNAINWVGGCFTAKKMIDTTIKSVTFTKVPDTAEIPQYIARIEKQIDPAGAAK